MGADLPECFSVSTWTSFLSLSAVTGLGTLSPPLPLLQWVAHCCYSLFSRSVMSSSLWTRGLQHTRLPVLHYLPELAQTHFHQVGDAIQPSHPLSPPSAPVFPSIRVFSSELTILIRWPKYRSFSISPLFVPDPGIEPRSLALQANPLPSEPPGKPHLLVALCFLAWPREAGVGCALIKAQSKKSLCPLVWRHGLLSIPDPPV